MNIVVTSPFPFEALPRIWRWCTGFWGKLSDDFSPRNQQEFVAFAMKKWEQQKTWAVYADGELGGLIVFERANAWLGTAHWIFKPEFQGKGMAVIASRIAIAEMFTEVQKLAFYPLAGNFAIGSVLIKLGAKREGTLVEHTLCNGKPTDMWVYGLTKLQFEENENAMGSSNSSNHRRNIEHRGRSDGGAYNHHDPDAIARPAGAPGLPAELQQKADERPGGRYDAHAAPGHESDQPAVPAIAATGHSTTGGARLR